MCRLLLEHVYKIYPNGVRAVDDASLEVRPGELLVIVGPSGSGKTTLLRLIAGLERVSSGRIAIGDRPVTDVSTDERDVAMVFQQAALFPHMTVRENMAFSLKMRKVRRGEIDRRVREAAERLAIDELLDRRPAELSGGERRRVAIGKALVRAPKALLCDEPLTDLDPILRATLRDEFVRLRCQFASPIVYVTHDQAEAMALGDRLCVLNQGRVQQLDTPEAVYSMPANSFVASFIGDPGMNLIAGGIRDGVFYFQDGTGRERKLTFGLSSPPDGPVMLGVRPESITLEDTGLALGDVKLSRIERLGNASLVYFSIGDDRHTARFPSNAAIHLDRPMAIYVRPGDLHFFSVDDGRRLP
jgi:multiple sugar transport system ATP-binding protein